jgi:hypothetical protein
MVDLREWGIPSRSRRSNFPFLGMKIENLVFWFGNQLLERGGDSFSQQALKLSVPRHEKRECKKPGLVWKQTLRESGGFLLAEGAQTFYGDKKEDAKKLVLWFGNQLSKRESGGFLLAAGAQIFRS